MKKAAITISAIILILSCVVTAGLISAKNMLKNGKADKAMITGDFIQPGTLASDWTPEEWEKHFSDLSEAGIDTFIVQWSVLTKDGKISEVFYEAGLDEFEKNPEYNETGNKRNLLKYCLEAAEKRGIKVFVGLNFGNEWWQKKVNDDIWYENESDIGNAVAKEIYDLYKKDYPNALHGFYWAFEMDNNLISTEMAEKYADMLNINLDYITKLDPTMPLILSPYITVYTDPQETENLLKDFFAAAHFRKGDIYACQDSVGAGHIDITQLDEYYSAIKDAVDTKPGLLFWANNECFNLERRPAPLSRFAEQIKISDKYVSKHITFSYTHHFSPLAGRGEYHEAYKHYYKTGEITEY